MFRSVPLVDFESIRNICPFRISIWRSITNDVIKEQNKYNVYAHLSMCSGDLFVLVQTDALLTEVLPSGSAHLENVVVLLQQQDRLSYETTMVA